MHENCYTPSLFLFLFYLLSPSLLSLYFRFFSPNSYTYSGGNPASLNNISSNLGDRLSFRVSLRNSGPSPFRGYINVHIPAKGSGEDYYYFYPAKLVGTCSCNEYWHCNTFFYSFLLLCLSSLLLPLLSCSLVVVLFVLPLLILTITISIMSRAAGYSKGGGGGGVQP